MNQIELPHSIRFQLCKVFRNSHSTISQPPDLIEFKLLGTGWEKHFQLPITEVSAKKLEKRCGFLRFPTAKSRSAFDQALMSMLFDHADALPSGYFFQQQGSAKLNDGRLCFIRGDALIGAEQPYALAPQIQHIRLLGEPELLGQLPDLLLDAPSPVYLTLSYVVLTAVRSFLLERGVDLQAVLYIQGKSGFGKTYLASRLAGFVTAEGSGKPMNILQATSSLASTKKMLSALRDLPVVIDDLCLSASKATQRKRKEIGAELIRIGASTSPTSKQCGADTAQIFCAAGLILTAEFSMENLSDLNRCLIVPIDEQLNISSGFCPELTGSLVNAYSRWFVTHSDQELHRFLAVIDNSAESFCDSRMATNYASLEAAAYSLVAFLADIGLVSPRTQAIIMRNSIVALKRAIAVHQLLHKQLLESVCVGNLPFCIFTGFENNAFSLAKKMSRLVEKDGILVGDDLCLKPESLVQFVRNQPGYHDWTRNQISRALNDMKILVLQGDGYTVHLDSDGKHRLPRVYRLRLSVLKKMCVEY